MSVDGMCCWSATLESTNCLTARLNKCFGYLSFKNTVTTADTKFHVTSVSRKKRVLYGEKIIVHAHMNVPRKKIPSARSPSKGN